MMLELVIESVSIPWFENLAWYFPRHLCLAPKFQLSDGPLANSNIESTLTAFSMTIDVPRSLDIRAGQYLNV